jgi:hypothetical protein
MLQVINRKIVLIFTIFIFSLIKLSARVSQSSKKVQFYLRKIHQFLH